ncbi:hypothetical protein BDD12DRAFT_519421 [Trichophaea hybrida]|nr:hypothetical protein BDD12DRAFT_519421 [Trichophaea hybrida]
MLPLPSGDITLKDVLHIPSLGFSSLLSLRLIHQSGCQIVFNQPASAQPAGCFEGSDHVMHILNGPDIIVTATHTVLEICSTPRLVPESTRVHVLDRPICSCHIVYREPSRQQETVSLLDFLTAHATISNIQDTPMSSISNHRLIGNSKSFLMLNTSLERNTTQKHSSVFKLEENFKLGQ